MSTMTWALLGAILGLLLPWCALRLWPRAQAASRPGPTGREATAPRGTGTIRQALARRFHGVTVRPGLVCCQAAQALTGRRFLSQEAPALPLPGCDQKTCQCAYSHFRDRRDGEDRRAGWGSFGGFNLAIPGGNRRGNSRIDRRGR